MTHHGTPELEAALPAKMVAGVDRHDEPDRAAGRLRPGRDAQQGRAAGRRHYRISGQKIFITWGEHDMAENIVHLVLARLPDAPPGVKGISLFLVPKFLVNADGSLGERNDHCVSIEHKMGIHASPPR
jgi:alkylation response protein AidB-like acyl-CoA dehydrogenase